jgi:hypothetical protein
MGWGFGTQFGPIWHAPVRFRPLRAGPPLSGRSKVAAAVLLANTGRPRGRDRTQPGLAGWLLRNSWSVEEVPPFTRAVAIVASDSEVEMRVNTVARSNKKLLSGKKVSSLPKLIQALGKKNGGAGAERVTEWPNSPGRKEPESRKKCPVRPPAVYQRIE